LGTSTVFRGRRVQLLVGVVGFGGIGSPTCLAGVAPVTPWPSAIQATAGCLLGLSTVLEFGVASYRHYVRKTAIDEKTRRMTRSTSTCAYVISDIH
jgi:hypothetical protein